jgi:hypothetical protein
VEKVDFGYSLKPSSSVGQMRFNVSQGGSYLLYFNVFYANNNSLRQPINECFTVSAPQRSYYSFPSQKRNGVAYAGKYSGNSYVNVRVNKAITVSELSAFTIDVVALEQAIGNASAIGITEGRGGFSGSIVANGGECVFLSLPYDSGMRLKINGKSAELYKVYDGFTAFYLEEGVNEIFISFTPRGFGAGLSLCIMGIAIIIAYCALKKRMAFSEGFVAIFEKVAFIAVLTAGIATIFIVYVAPIVLCVL